MLDFIKKAALAGVGAASLTTEKIEELGGELMLKGKLTEMEGRKFIDEMQVKANESKEALKKQTETVVEQVLDKMNLAQADEVKALKEEIEKLKAELEAVKK